MKRLKDYGIPSVVLATDRDSVPVGHRWWLDPTVFDLTQTLKEQNCSESQIRQVYESLLSGQDTHLVLEVPD